MEERDAVLNTCALFTGITDGELEGVLNCLAPKTRKYSKNDTVLIAGDDVTSVGIILSGKVQVVKVDFSGNKNIMTELSTGELFAEVFSFAKIKKLPVTVISVTESVILFIDYKKIITPCAFACEFHRRLIENMMWIIAQKNVMLNQKIEHISKRTTREKLISYLSAMAQKSDSFSFDIPFDRQGLADYLCVERSAMSAELSKMKSEGLIDYYKNSFRLLTHK